MRTKEDVLPIWKKAIRTIPEDQDIDSLTYQEYHGDIQHESDQSVDDEREYTNVENIPKCHVGHFDEKCDYSIHKGARRSEVIKRDQRIHLELSGAQESLHQRQTNGFEGDAS